MENTNKQRIKNEIFEDFLFNLLSQQYFYSQLLVKVNFKLHFNIFLNASKKKQNNISFFKIGRKLMI